MSRFVLDASIALTWCFPDEESQMAQEVAGEKRKRLTPELTQSFLDDLDRLP